MEKVERLKLFLKRHSGSLFLCSAPLFFAALVVALISPILKPQQTQLDPAMLEALLEDPIKNENNEIISKQNKGSLDNQRLDLKVPNADQPAPSLEIRVMLQETKSTSNVGANGPWQLQLRNGSTLRTGQGMLPLSCSEGRLQIGGDKGPNELWLRPKNGGIVALDAKSYRGELRFYCDRGGLVIVNHVQLEEYIASVVGAEMPSDWPEEALRAQAVAARSYALAHMARPADPHWNLGATTRWQAYDGLESESEASRVAGSSTMGLVLSYRGGIVESLYAADKKITSEAHDHLGASMSQHGAKELAQQGYRFSQILARYYRGANLARLKRSA
ncbi:SpoIID/LytB domain-containing protein [Synechococcus sp. UW140]|uniref:SpoIID/LytB domain-containing protein n=1 Tax=Synechococcus sp. UW140 TaxID=368503 RepID=UPI0025DBE265|nr:SpoIID/LytB domain-containing protein [Synechococcus sp. UW140]